MKPFNADAAIQGAEVITASKLSVTELTYYPGASKYKFAGLCAVKSELTGKLEPEILTWDMEGRVNPSYTSHYDLFMAPVLKTKYAAKELLAGLVTYPTIEAVKRNNGQNAEIITITWEE